MELPTLAELRKPRIYISEDTNISVFDTVGTLAIALGVSKYYNWNPYVTTVGAFGLGLATHLLMMEMTPGTKKVMSMVSGSDNNAGNHHKKIVSEKQKKHHVHH